MSFIAEGFTAFPNVFWFFFFFFNFWLETSLSKAEEQFKFPLLLDTSLCLPCLSSLLLQEGGKYGFFSWYIWNWTLIRWCPGPRAVDCWRFLHRRQLSASTHVLLCLWPCIGTDREAPLSWTYPSKPTSHIEKCLGIGKEEVKYWSPRGGGSAGMHLHSFSHSGDVYKVESCYQSKWNPLPRNAVGSLPGSSVSFKCCVINCLSNSFWFYLEQISKCCHISNSSASGRVLLKEVFHWRGRASSAGKSLFSPAYLPTSTKGGY